MERTIFVVDGLDINLMLAEKHLEDRYSVFTMPTVQKMFLLLTMITPHLILIDVDIQDMDAFDALSYLKSDVAYAHIPVVMTTGSRNSYIDTKSLELGAMDLMIKPFSPSLIRNRAKIYIDYGFASKKGGDISVS